MELICRTVTPPDRPTVRLKGLRVCRGRSGGVYITGADGCKMVYGGIGLPHVIFKEEKTVIEHNSDCLVRLVEDKVYVLIGGEYYDADTF